ncbi:lipid storage droplets surface-binding protein 2-like [Ctenocephalides felis]|uniref:lipid storage droplets surface-binding protein 2-like n=1 Tax=Ctenocephalides felis TaxID=7515 RepID=UPI000E6E371E|nr:lipid storage droplets surface-binding protein 2-like [Ctenocephalides felis]
MADKVPDTNQCALAQKKVDGAKSNPSLLPHLESLERMMKLPMVEAAWAQSQGVYDKVKGYNPMLTWAFGTAESTVQLALATASPYIQKIDKPIHYVDETLVKGINKLEASVPIVKEQPQEILNQTREVFREKKEAITKTVQDNVHKVCTLRKMGNKKAQSLKDLSWNKANEVLATQYGNMAVEGIDSTSILAEKLLDYYFPATEKDLQEAENDDGSSVTPLETDRVLHTVQTVGHLSNKVARRVYRNVAEQLKNLNKEDVQEYVASLIAVLRLTQYLSFLNNKRAVQENKEENGNAVAEH